MFSRDNLSCPPFALGIWRTDSLIRQKPNNTMLPQQFFNISETNISIYDIYTGKWPFCCLTSKCDIDLQLSRTNVSNEQLCLIILKYMHKSRRYGLDKLNIWPFYHLTLKCDLDLQPTWTNVLNEQLSNIILKSVHKCTSYGPDKLN